jgi:hypothetical protein
MLIMQKIPDDWHKKLDPFVTASSPTTQPEQSGS